MEEERRDNIEHEKEVVLNTETYNTGEVIAKKPASSKLKIVILIVVLFVAIIVVAMKFMGSNSAATIVDNNGNTVELTAEELQDIYNENEAQFEKLYSSASITLVGTVEKIEVNVTETLFGGGMFNDDIITLKEGWIVKLVHDSHKDLLLKLNKGDKIEVKSEISDVEFKGVEIADQTSYDAYNWTEKSTVTIIE